MFSLLLFLILLLLAIIIIYLAFVNNLLAIALITVVISLIVSVLYILLNAVDVAITEAAVGAGISTILIVGVIFLTRSFRFSDEDYKSTRYTVPKYKMILYLLPFIAMLYILLDSIASMPLFGNIINPSNNALYRLYLQQSFFKYQVDNAVTMILGSFRGYDTLGETLVIILAALSVYIILLNNNSNLTTKIITTPLELINIKPTHFIPTAFLFIMLPTLLLFATYIQFHGDMGPGGGFQAGVVLATPYILYFLYYGAKNVEALLQTKTLVYMMTLGVLIYVTTGVITLCLGGNYLDYFVLGYNNTHAYHYGLFAIEFGIGLSVFSSMYLIIHQFFLQMQFQTKEEL